MQSLPIIATLLLGVLSSWTAVRVARIGRGVEAVSRSVNHVPPGTPTLIERVRRDARTADLRWDWTVEAVGAIGLEVGATLPEPPHISEAA